jgi:AraC-like DNA-binding protein
MITRKQRKELENLSATLSKAFSYIKNTSFFMKDLDGKFVAANKAFLRLTEITCLADILGKTDLDFVPAKLARAYMNDDRKVMETGEALDYRIEPLPNENPTAARILTSKLPIRSMDGTILGLIGIARDLTDGARQSTGTKDFLKAMTRLEDQKFKRYDANALARMQGMSKSKFEREFKKHFHVTPAAYHLQTRLRYARNDLLDTTSPVSEIAIDHGFCDQSHFTKKFVMAYGVTPLRFRRNSNESKI